MDKLLIFSVVAFVAACSNKAIYDNIQHSNRRQCAELPPSQYEQCVKQANKPYEEYEKERQEALEK